MGSDSVDVKIPFGVYTGLTINEVSRLPDGERFLLNLVNNRSIGKLLRQAIQEFYQLTETRSKH